MAGPGATYLLTAASVLAVILVGVFGVTAIVMLRRRAAQAARLQIEAAQVFRLDVPDRPFERRYRVQRPIPPAASESLAPSPPAEPLPRGPEPKPTAQPQPAIEVDRNAARRAREVELRAWVSEQTAQAAEARAIAAARRVAAAEAERRLLLERTAAAERRALLAERSSAELQAELHGGDAVRSGPRGRRLSRGQSQSLANGLTLVRPRVPEVAITRLGNTEASLYAADLIAAFDVAGVRVVSNTIGHLTPPVYGVLVYEAATDAVIAPALEAAGVVLQTQPPGGRKVPQIVVGLQPP